MQSHLVKEGCLTWSGQMWVMFESNGEVITIPEGETLHGEQSTDDVGSVVQCQKNLVLKLSCYPAEENRQIQVSQ